MSGYTGKILIVDLRKETYDAIKFKETLARKLIGGKGLGAYLLYRYTTSNIDPFLPENTIIVASGPLNNTRVPLASKIGFFFKSPLTNGYGESFVGGSIPRYPKALGYDAVVLLGKAKRKVILVFHEEGIEFVDAGEYWGIGIIEVDNDLRKKYGKAISTALIGPAGENRVRYAAISVDKWRQAARGGGGAVLGAKNVKGLVFVGGEPWVSVAREEEFSEILGEILGRIKNYSGLKSIREYGTSAMAITANKMGFFPTKYWSSGRADNWEAIGPDGVKRLLHRVHACWGCPFACGRYVCFDWKGKNFCFDGLEYETIYALGGLIGVNDINALAFLNYMADDLGLDTISLGNVLGLVVEASRKNKINSSVDYGDVEGFISLIEKIAYRESIGDILAEGVARVAEKFGISDRAIHVKNLEPAGYDPRVLKSMSLAYGTSPRGACHLRSMGYIIDIRRLAGEPDIISREKVLKFLEFEEWMASFDSLILCKFGRDIYDFDLMIKLYNAVTGFEVSNSEYREALKRVVLLTRLFNQREGFRRDNDILPKRFFAEPLKIGSKKYILDEAKYNEALDLYYMLRGLNRDGTIKGEVVRELKRELELVF